LGWAHKRAKEMFEHEGLFLRCAKFYYIVLMPEIEIVIKRLSGGFYAKQSRK
jgi:hypothetical protein